MAGGYSPEDCRARACSVAAMQMQNRRMDPREIMRRREEYLARIAPYLQIMANLLNMQPVRYIITAPAEVEAWAPDNTPPLIGPDYTREVMWHDDAKALYDQAQALVDSIGKEYINLEG